MPNDVCFLAEAVLAFSPRLLGASRVPLRGSLGASWGSLGGLHLGAAAYGCRLRLRSHCGS
eukprot:9498035-Pyramimonas_sp.AAC.1